MLRHDACAARLVLQEHRSACARCDARIGGTKATGSFKSRSDPRGFRGRGPEPDGGGAEARGAACLGDLPQIPELDAISTAKSRARLEAFWNWLVRNRGRNSAVEALLLVMLTVQRGVQNTKPCARSLDRDRAILNGRSHCRPLPKQAAQILETLSINEHRFYFASAEAGCADRHHSKPASDSC